MNVIQAVMMVLAVGSFIFFGAMGLMLVTAESRMRADEWRSLQPALLTEAAVSIAMWGVIGVFVAWVW